MFSCYRICSLPLQCAIEYVWVVLHLKNKQKTVCNELADFLQVYFILFFVKKKGYEQNNLEDELADFLERV